MHFRAGGNEDGLRRAGTGFNHIGAAGDIRHLPRIPVLVRQSLAGKHQGGGAVASLDRGFPGYRGLHGVAGPPGVHVRGGTQGRQLFDRLVRGAILPQADRIVSKYEDGLELHQCGHAYGVAHIVLEHQEGGAVIDEPPVQGDAIHHGRHAEFSDAVVDIVAIGVSPSDML